MESKLRDWRFVFAHEKKKLIVALIFFVIAMILYISAGDYTRDHGGVAVPDLILDRIGPYDLGFIFVWLFILITALFFIHPVLFNPRAFPYVLNIFSLFVAVRSGFIIFTHLIPPPDAIIIHFPGYLNLLSFSNSLFFSGHTGLPFLGFLIYRKYSKTMSYFMLASSFVMAITVLLMHVHYSIDVFSAYFISYGVYKFGNFMYAKTKND
jgi:hypothetical protein